MPLGYSLEEEDECLHIIANHRGSSATSPSSKRYFTPSLSLNEPS